MANWVMDENIFEIASNLNDERCVDALYLTEVIYRFHQLVLDHEGILMTKYRRFFDKSKILRIWFTKINKNSGHVIFRSSVLRNQVELRLDSLGFDPNDKCFVGAALNADRLIASEDGDFRKQPVEDYFRNDLQLEVLNLKESINQEAGKR